MSLDALKYKIATLERGAASAPAAVFQLGVPAIDAAAGGLSGAALHEAYAGSVADAASLSGFALALALRAACERPIVWIRHDYAHLEAGSPYAPGLAAMGFDVARLILVRARTPADALRAGEAAVACASLGAAVAEIWGEPRVLDLTASRRLALASRTAGRPAILIRAEAQPKPSAAASRWRVQAAPSAPLEAGSPGRPRFRISLLRNRGARWGGEWIVEWDHDRRSFRAASLAGGVAALPSGGRPAPQLAGSRRRAG